MGRGKIATHILEPNLQTVAISLVHKRYVFALTDLYPLLTASVLCCCA